MIKKFKDFNKPYLEYRKKVDALFAKKTDLYSNLLDGYIKDLPSKGLFQGVFYLISSFLDSESDKKQLFIQFPCKELGRKKSDQDKYFSILQHIAAEALHLATADSLDKYSVPESIQDCEADSLLFMGAKVLNPHDDVSRERIWKVVEEDGKKRLSEQLSDVKHFCTSESEKAFKDYRACTFKIKNNTILKNTEFQKKKILNQLTKVSEKLSLYRELKFGKQYNNALLVCYGDTWNNTLIGSEMLDSPVDEIKKYTDVKEDYDVVVFIGDRKYQYINDLVNMKLEYERYKKVIYIGSDIYDGYEERNDTVKYSFTFREIFSYFYYLQGSETGLFPFIKIHTNPFPWLDNVISEFNDELTIDGLSSDDRHNILSLAVYPFLGIEMNGDMKKNADRLRNFMLEDLGMGYEDITTFIQSYSNIVVPQSNPKDEALIKIRKKHPLNDFFLIDPYKEGYKKKLDKFIKDNGNRISNRLVVDAKGNWRSYVEILKYLLAKGVMGHYYILSYCQLDLIEKFMKEELEIYKAPYRKMMLDGLVMDMPEMESVENVDGDLASYYKPVSIESLNLRINSSGQKSTIYSLVDESGETYETTGDVILGLNRENIQTIYDENEELLPSQITFYEKPDNFQLLMKLNYSFPKNRDIDYYAQLWREALQRYCDMKFNGKFKEMQRRDFPYISDLKRYFTPACTVKFPRQISSIARKLSTMKLISGDDAIMILAANSANKQNSSNGADLKEALYNYKLTGVKDKILDTIETAAIRDGHTDITTDIIMASALKTVNIVEIKKIDNNNQ